MIVKVSRDIKEGNRGACSIECEKKTTEKKRISRGKMLA